MEEGYFLHCLKSCNPNNHLGIWLPFENVYYAKLKPMSMRVPFYSQIK